MFVGRGVAWELELVADSGADVTQISIMVHYMMGNHSIFP